MEQEFTGWEINNNNLGARARRSR